MAARGHVATWVGDFAHHRREARAAGHAPSPPRLADLVAQPQFDALRRFLAERAIAPEALQEELDPIIAQAVEAAGENDG